MSTIERAMRRLNGEAAGDDATRTDADEATDDAAPAEVTAALEAPAPAPMVEDKPVATAKTTAASRPAQSRMTAPSTAHSKQILELDFVSLKKLGFASPADSQTRLSEEFQQIKRKLIANTVPGVNRSNAPSNLIMVTSSVPGEGKTYTSMNLALSLAKEIDRTILAVDIDILKSDLSKLFGAYNRTGIYDYLSDPNLDFADVMMRTNVPTLSFIPAGTIREGITERLASQAMIDATRELAARYPDRLIIFDAPPVLATTGAAALAPMVGQVVLVVEAYRTTLETLRSALNVLEGVAISGVILNKIRHRAVGTGHGYGYGYEYGYGYGYRSKQSQQQDTA